MTTAIATPRPTFTGEQVELIRRTLCKDASNDELQLFLNQCERTGLDPFSRQIHATKRNGKLVIQTGIDGYRLIADRTGKYAGSDDPAYDTEDATAPRKATVTVWKLVGGMRVPFTRSARWKEYYPGKQLGFMWDKMPFHMLGKCAEALALRAAFPQELSGLYTDEEMDQAGHVHEAEVVHPEPPKAAQKVKLPKTGAELAERVKSRDEALAEAGVCQVGELQAAIDMWAEAEGLPQDPAAWTNDHISDAVAEVLRLEKQFRALRLAGASA